jgi:hypothetical protein
MEEKKGNMFGKVFLAIAGIIVIAVMVYTLNYFGVFKGKTNKNTTSNSPALSSQPIPVNVNDTAVVDGRVLYTFQGTIDKLTKTEGGYTVIFKDNPKEYFMPGGLNVMQIKSSGQAQVKPDTLKSGDIVTFSSVYNLKTQEWVKTYTAEDLQKLLNSR